MLNNYKLILSLSFLIIALAVGYYYVIFLPKEHQRQRELEEWKIKISEETNPVRLLDQCLNDANRRQVNFSTDLCKATPGCWDDEKDQVKTFTALPEGTLKSIHESFKLSEDECYRKYKE